MVCNRQIACIRIPSARTFWNMHLRENGNLLKLMLLAVLLVCNFKIPEMPVFHSVSIESAESKFHSMIHNIGVLQNVCNSCVATLICI